MLVGTEIADAVAGQEAKPDLAAALEQLGKRVDDFGDLVGLDQHFGIVDCVAHRGGELHLPRLRAVRRDDLENLAQMRLRQRIDLRVDAGNDPDNGNIPQHADRLVEATLEAAQAIVDLARAVDRNAQRADAGGGGGLDLFEGQPATAGLDRAVHPGVRDRLDDREPVAAQIRLAADQIDVARAELGKLSHDIETFLSGEFFLSRAAGA